jgi:hypothetical protein
VIEVDAKGNVWVGDQNNERIQEFNQSGEYIGQFGTAGSGAGQFSLGYPMGITSDPKGRLWTSDTGNNRVQKFSNAFQAEQQISFYRTPAVKYPYSGSYLSKMALSDPASTNNPSLNVNVASGLTSSVQGEAAGTTTYKYESAKLTTEQDSRRRYGRHLHLGARTDPASHLCLPLIAQGESAIPRGPGLLQCMESGTYCLSAERRREGTWHRGA